MSVSSEIKKANGLVSHSHKLIQLSWKPPKISKTPKNVARMKIKVQIHPHFYNLLLQSDFHTFIEKMTNEWKNGRNLLELRI